MKKISKKKRNQIIQWCLSVFFILFIFETGFHPSSILLIISALLMAPVKPLRNLLKKCKIKSGLAVSLSLIAFFVSIGTVPDIAQPQEGAQSTTAVSESVKNNEGSSKFDDKKEASKADTTKKNTQTGSGLSNHSTKPSPSKLPKYKGKPYEVLNGGKPAFKSNELTTKAYERYSPLDSLGRCQTAVASLGIETMPKNGEKRGSISDIHPSGWRQAKYESISSKDLYNRCHLIGWQLSAENANSKNLITGTRYMNVDGMLPFENMVADYIKESRNHVAYRVTPIYEGNNLVASGVQIEAYSIEDNGDGICFNVYCFNVQPGIKINYANGESSGPDGGMLSPNKNSSNSSSKNSNTSPSHNSRTVYITPSGKCYHYDKECAGKNAKAKSFDEVKDNYKPCKTCVH